MGIGDTCPQAEQNLFYFLFSQKIWLPLSGGGGTVGGTKPKKPFWWCFFALPARRFVTALVMGLFDHSKAKKEKGKKVLDIIFQRS